MSVTQARPAQPPCLTPLPPPRPALPYSSSALPGDPYHPATGPADFEISPSTSSDSGEGTSLDAGARSAKPPGLGAAAGPGEADPGPGVGPVLQFFTRLRRHASLDGASPYFKVKKWKLEPNQRASSLDTRGSPKRHHFQRQRAASESMEQEGDTPHVDFIQYIASAGATMAFPPPHPFVASPTSPPPTLGRLEAEEAAGPAGGASPESPPENGGGSGWGPQQQQESDGERDAGSEQVQTIYHDIWSLRASLELHAATASDQSSNDRDSVRSGDSSGSGGTAPAFPPLSPPPTPRSMDGEAGGSRKLLQMDSGYASIEGRSAGEDGPPSLPEKRSSFTSAGHMATMGVSFEGAPAEAPTRPCGPHVWPRHAPRRDYSVDEKTDALFHEFLRHDPHFDNAPPITARHRTRAHPHPHVRKQWQQRGRQHSDPGAHAAPPAPPGADPCPMRAPLRRGDSVDCTSDTHTGDDLAVPAAPAIPAIEEEPCSGCPGSSLCIGPPGQMLDKLAAGLEDRLFPPHLVQSVSVVPMLAAAAAPTSPDHSPA